MRLVSVPKGQGCSEPVPIFRYFAIYPDAHSVFAQSVQFATNSFPADRTWASDPNTNTSAYMVNLASGPPRLLKTALGEVYHINLKGC